MTFWEKISSELGFDIGVYDRLGNIVWGIDLGFINTDDCTIYENKTYIPCDKFIVAVKGLLSQDACTLIKAAHSIINEKNSIPIVDSLEFIINNDVPRSQLAGKYDGLTSFYIAAEEDIYGVISAIYEDEYVNLVKDGSEGIYLIKETEDPSIEADAIIHGLWHENGISCIIGCSRRIHGDYTVKDAAVHSKSAYKVANAFGNKNGFFHIDKIIVKALIKSINEEDLSFYIHGGYEGFMHLVRDKELIDTAEQLFKCNLNISEASRNLYVHRNTLLYRIDKIKNLTSLDIKRFDDALSFNIIISILKLKGFVK